MMTALVVLAKSLRTVKGDIMDKHLCRAAYRNGATCCVRVKRTFFKDTIHKGMTLRNFKDQGYGMEDIKVFLKKGWIRKEQIKNEQGTILTVYALLLSEEPQRSSRKKFFERVLSWFQRFFGQF